MNAILDIGEAQHPLADDTSPPHTGFQVWFGPADGIVILGLLGYPIFVEVHHWRESPTVYDNKGNAPADTVAAEMHSHLLDALKE